MPVLSADSADSVLTLVNPSLAPVNVTLTARSYVGNVLEGYGIINPVSVTLPASSIRALKAKDLFGQGVGSGWVELQTGVVCDFGGFLSFEFESNRF